MSNFDEIMSRKETAEKKQMTPKERNEQRKKDIEGAAQKAVSSIEEFEKYLEVQSRFDRYSVGNILFIYAQRPNATRLKSVELWNKDKKWVKEGSKAVYIYEPKKTVKDGKTYTDFTRKAMFDIADIKDAEPEAKATYTPYEAAKALFAFKEIEVKTIPDYPTSRQFGAFFEAKENCIYARENMSVEQIFTDVAMALSHAQMANGDPAYSNGSFQFEARCSAYVLAKKYGIPTDKIMIDSIPEEYKAMSANDLQNRLLLIHENVKAIESNMYKALVKAKEEKTVSPKAKESKGGDAR